MGNLVVKDNALIQASHKLNEIEQRLILLAIIKIREQYNSIEQAKNKEITIHADDYISVFNVERNAAYKALKQAVVGLYRAEWGYQTINKRGNVEVVYERFTQNAKYVEAEATVKFMFSTAIIPLLIELEKNFTSYQIEQVSNLSSRYSMRLFELLMQHFDKKSGKGWLEISLNDLRFRFGLLKDEYEQMNNFKNRVLDVAIIQINESTDYIVTYNQKKQGRKIIGFRFDIKTKTEVKPQKIKERDVNTIDMFDNLTDKEREIVAEKNAYADKINATDLHRQNLIKQGLSEYRSLQDSKHKQREKQKADEQVKKKNNADLLELSQNFYSTLVGADDDTKAQFAHDNAKNFCAGAEKHYYQNHDFDMLILAIKYKFENTAFFKTLNVDALK